MASQFSFSFGGDDIDEDELDDSGEAVMRSDPLPAGASTTPANNPTASTAASPAGSASATAFPVPGKPQLTPTRHAVRALLSSLPSRIAFGVLDVALDGGGGVARLPRRELWDVRAQLMAEADLGTGGGDHVEAGLGSHDVRTGVYEGGFKSWESSVDLVKVMAAGNLLAEAVAAGRAAKVVELGCGTALPSLALFQWAISSDSPQTRPQISFTLADYNPSVLHLVTLPNFLLTWALAQSESSMELRAALDTDGTLEVTEEVAELFLAFLSSKNISLSFLSGGWSEEFVTLLYTGEEGYAGMTEGDTLLIGAETIYSPFALEAFTGTVFSILHRETERFPATKAQLLVGAKRLYFGVGGSLDDFIQRATNLGATVTTLREETEGVRRGVVLCSLAN